MSFIGAGIIFYDQYNVLAGFNKKLNIISGIGGKPLLYEKPLKTAKREMLEELFELDSFDIINIDIIPNNIVVHNQYCSYLLDFNKLQQILDILNSYQIKSKLYDNFPKNISELIFNRKVKEATEIGQLCLLPLVNNLKIDKDFVIDLNLIQK
jgi:hypothetical protein